MKKIIVSVTNDLATDQRVSKVCHTLYKNGFEIILVGRKLKNSLPIQRSYATKRFRLFFNNGILFYAEYNFRLFLFLLFSKKCILLSNDLDTLLPNYLISVLQRKLLVYDSHELFSEIPELVHRPYVKQFWVKLENILIPKLKNSYTVCQSIANYYDSKHGTNFKVIKNYPYQKSIEKGLFPFKIHQKKIIFYQGAINIGRGLELMIESMFYLPNYLFVIAGTGDIYDDLNILIKEKNIKNVHFLGRIEPKRLQKITPLADLGISLEEDLGLNYRYALPNKIFDYIHAEIPILTSNLPEMKQIVLNFKVGEIVKKRDPEAIAYQIKTILEKDYSKALKSAKKVLLWEEEKLITLFKNLK